MAQIDIPDEIIDAVKAVADLVDITPGNLISRLIFSGIKKAQLTPQQRAAINNAHAKAASPAAQPPPS